MEQLQYASNNFRHRDITMKRTSKVSLMKLTFYCGEMINNLSGSNMCYDKKMKQSETENDGEGCYFRLGD